MNKRVHEVDVSDFDKLHAVNERGVWLCCKYALKQMLEQEPREPNRRGEKTRGWVLNAASMLGLVAYPNVSCYVPGKCNDLKRSLSRLGANGTLCGVLAKHAVVGMTKQMAIDYAKDRIHVNCLCPGFVESPMISSITADPQVREGLAATHPWNALGTPEDIADAALYLCSDEA